MQANVRTTESAHDATLSIVTPVFNERDNVAPLLGRIQGALASFVFIANLEIIYVDDVSRDDTADQIRFLASRFPNVRLLSLSRNFGHQAALFAGLEAARGQIVITLDGDLQHPPELI